MFKKSKLEWVPWVVGLGLFIENIDITVINTSLPEIARSLNTDPLDLKIGITSYLLTLAMLIPISGYIADRIGTKKTFSLAIAIFMFGSVICGMATSLSSIILGRLIQGAGGAIMAPVGRLILVKMFPRSEFVQAFSYVVIVGQIATAIGPILGGVITNYIDWRFIFFLNIPVSIIALILVNLCIENVKTEKKVKFDFIGFLLFGIATTLVLLPLTIITQRGAVNSIEYYLLGIGILSFLLYYFYSKKIEYPAIELQLFKTRTYRLSSIGNIISRTAVGGVPFMLPLLFQLNFGLHVLQASLFLLPYGFGFLCAKFVLKRLLNKFGFKKMLISNTLFLSGMLIVFAGINVDTNVQLINILIFIFGGLSSLQFSYMSILNYVDIEWDKLSKATSLSSVIQQLSMGFGVCLVAGSLVFFDSSAETELIPLAAFQYTFYILSILMFLALFCFIRLRTSDGIQVLNRVKTEIEEESSVELSIKPNNEANL